jgi:hypothetical protein
MIRLIAAVALTASVVAATAAHAFFMDDEGPPKGLNGFTVNGISLKGLNGGGVSISAIVLADGSRVRVK